MNEDEPLNDAFNLLSFIDDIDNKKTDLKFSIDAVGSKYVKVDIDTQSNIDITPAEHYFGTSSVVLNATDGTNFNTTSFDIIIENVNDIPEVELVKPTYDNIIYKDYVVLEWTGSDNDPDDESQLTYTIYLDIISGNRSYYSGYQGTSINITNLADKATYYWKVIPNDGKIEGVCLSKPSPSQFRVDLSKRSHTVLKSPADGAVTNIDSITLEWESYSEDNDYIYYDIYLSTDILNEPYPLTALWEKNVIDKNWELNNLTPGNTYYWTVIPFSSKGKGVCDSGIWSFNYDPTAVPYNLQIEAPTKLNIKKGEFHLEEIKVTNLGDNPDIFMITISAGKEKYLVTLDGVGSEHIITPDESLIFIMNVSADKLPIGTYDIKVSVESLRSGQFETASIALEISTKEEGSAQELYMYTSLSFVIIIIIILIIFFLFLRYKRLQEDKKRVDAELLKPAPGEKILDAKEVEYSLGAGRDGTVMRPDAGLTREPIPTTFKPGAQKFPLLPPSQEEVDRFLKNMLDRLDAKFINEEMSEETYQELKKKYEERLSKKDTDKEPIDGEKIEELEADIRTEHESKIEEREPEKVPKKKVRKKKRLKRDQVQDSSKVDEGSINN
jgi:hypothetical protein